MFVVWCPAYLAKENRKIQSVNHYGIQQPTFSRLCAFVFVLICIFLSDSIWVYLHPFLHGLSSGLALGQEDLWPRGICNVLSFLTDFTDDTRTSGVTQADHKWVWSYRALSFLLVTFRYNSCLISIFLLHSSWSLWTACRTLIISQVVKNVNSEPDSLG